VFIVEPLQPPAQLAIVSGGAQRAVIGTPYQPVVVRLATTSGVPIMGAQLFLEPGGAELEPGSTFPASVTTDASGVATLPTLVARWGVGTVTTTVRYFDNEARAYVRASTDLLATNAQGGLTLSFQDLWWSGPLENGWGMSIVQHGDQLFNVLFVYDAAGKPTWYVQPGGQWPWRMGELFVSPVYSPRGSPWF